MSNLLDEIRQAIIEGDDEAAQAKAEEALMGGAPAPEVLNKAIVPGIEGAGRLWRENKYFLPDVILSAGAFKAACDVVEPYLTQSAEKKAGRILLGVVEGDMHDLGPLRRWQFGSDHPGVCNFTMGDGSVKGLSVAIDLEVLRMLAMRDDGETIPTDLESGD